MRIRSVLVAEDVGGFFNDDQAAIAAGAVHDGDIYLGTPVTPGFSSVRVPAEALSIGVVLEDDSVHWGDAMSVQYAGVAGRDPLFDPREQSRVMMSIAAPALYGLDADTFRSNCEGVACLRSDGYPLHVGLQYGMTQALLRAAASVRRRTMVEVLAQDYALALVPRAVPIHCQSGDARRRNTERMILKRVESLPHGLINSPEAFGAHGELFLEFVSWVAARIGALAPSDYRPTLHFDLYGSIGRAFGRDMPLIIDFIATAERAASPFQLRLESPVDFRSRTGQIEGSAELVGALRTRGIRTQIVVDEWCNSLADIEAFAKADSADMIQIKVPDLGGVQESVTAVRICHDHGVAAYLGGSCTETDLSAQVCVNLAIATGADLQLAKPGMGVDEGLMVVRNEQARVLACLRERFPVPA